MPKSAPALLLAGLFLAVGAPDPLVAADPFLLGDIRTDGQANQGSAPKDFWALGDVVVFNATDPDHGRELWASDGTAAGTELVADICPHLCSSAITPLWVTDGLLYFNATSQEVASGKLADARALGRLWRTDGTPGGTVLLGEVRGRARMGRSVASGVEIFVGEDAEHGREPWVTDGTPGGTRLLRDLAPGPADSTDGFFSPATLGDRLLFSACTPALGCELWQTDGTPHGTTLVRDLRPGTSPSFPASFESLGDRAIFTAFDEVHGRELRVTDGTPGGTRVVRDIVPGSRSTGFLESGDRTFFVDSGRAFFLAWTEFAIPEEGPPHQTPLLQLWVTDGTASGTKRLTDFNSPFAMVSAGASVAPFFTVRFMASIEGSVFFVAEGGTDGRELWVTDGTPSGTRQFIDLCPGSCSSFPDSLRGFGPAMSFKAQQGEQFPRLWVSDGTVAGTGEVAELCSESCRPFIEFRVPFEDGLLFGATLNEGGASTPTLWRSGSEPGTGEEIARWDASANYLNDQSIRNSAFANGRVFFGLSDREHRSEPWVTGGTAGTTVLLKDIAGERNFGSNPRQLTSVGDRALFVAYGNDDTIGLWVTDGTPAGTRHVVELSPFSSVTTEPKGMTAIGDRLYFWSDPIGAPPELWVSDGTVAGTERRATIPDFQRPLVEIGGWIFFASDSALWRIDDSLGEAERIEELEVRLGVFSGTLVAWEQNLWFIARRPGFGQGLGLWRTDGTPGGAVPILDPEVAGAEVWAFRRPVAVGDTLFFVAEDPEHGPELWATDGTPEGTRLVADLVPGADLKVPGLLRASSGGLVFTLDDPEEGPGLWRSDGSPEGTFLLRRFVEPADRFADFQFAVEINGQVLFAANDGRHGTELWRTDGTVTGTRLVADLEPGPEGAELREITVLGETAYFTVFTTAHGRQIWRSDGTPGGTVRLTDRSSGISLSRFNTEIARAGETIVFPAHTPRLGNELWGLPLDAEPAGPPAEPPPPAGPWLSTPDVPGFRFKVRIEQGAQSPIPGAVEPECIPETLCVSGALPGRSEVFVRVVGPKPNGRLWPTLVKFTTSGVQVWIEQATTGIVRHYRLDGVGPGENELSGLFDRTGFIP